MTFDEIKAQPGQSLVLFYSLTCGPCKSMKPMLTELCAESGVTLHQVNIASEMPAVRELGIRAVPTLVRVRAGQAEVTATGALTATAAHDMLAAAGLLKGA